MNLHLNQKFAHILIQLSISSLILATFFGPATQWNQAEKLSVPHSAFQNNRQHENLPDDLTANASPDAPIMRRSSLTPTIIGGEKAAEDAYPWTVALVKTGSVSLPLRQYCGGTLIHPEWVLTAAHCTYSGTIKRTPESINVLVGTTVLDDGHGQEIKIREIIRHPDYNRSSATLDIALLHLAEPVALPTIDLGHASYLSEAVRKATIVLGWGKTQDKARSNELLQVNVPIAEWETCRTAYAAYGHNVDKTMVCAGYPEGGKDACVGDSGGPLVAPILSNAEGTILEWALIGVVSWGKGCAKANAYGVYADVAYVTEWITVHTSVTSAMTTTGVRGTANYGQYVYVPVIQ